MLKHEGNLTACFIEMNGDFTTDLRFASRSSVSTAAEVSLTSSKGMDVGIVRLPAASIPRAHIQEQADGLLKVVIDKKTGKIPGASFFVQNRPKSSSSLQWQ